MYDSNTRCRYIDVSVIHFQVVAERTTLEPDNSLEVYLQDHSVQEITAGMVTRASFVNKRPPPHSHASFV